MSTSPSLVFVPGSWHKPSCYNKIIKPLEDEYEIECIPVTLPSTQDNPNATFKDDIDAVRTAITSETTQGRDVIVVAHSYGGMVGNSAIKGLTRPKPSTTNNSTATSTLTQRPNTTLSKSQSETSHGHVTALILIASGYTITGFAFMDPFFGHSPPQWYPDKQTGYATLRVDPRDFFYHDLPDEEAAYWVSQLTTQSLKALYEGGEHAYAGWWDVPTWYFGTVEDKGLPVVVQRMQVAAVRSQGAAVEHVELQSSHSPFLSMPDEVVELIIGVVKAVGGLRGGEEVGVKKRKGVEVPMVKLGSPGTWFRYGIPYFFGRAVGWGCLGFMRLRRLWRR